MDGAAKAQPTASAVIAAAGSGDRLGASGPKAFVDLGGRPLLAWSLAAFGAAESVGSIVIVVPAGEEQRAASIAAEAGVAAAVVRGGKVRADSVRAGVEGLAGLDAGDPPLDVPAPAPQAGEAGPALVAVHDAARPLVTAELIDEVIGLLASRPDADAAIAAAPITDTVKRAREPRVKGGVARGGPTVAKTESRDHLWAAQTPQVFRLEPLRAALAGDPQRVAAATDEATLIEIAGGKVLICPAPAHNLKVTTAEDLQVAGFLLAR